MNGLVSISELHKKREKKGERKAACEKFSANMGQNFSSTLCKQHFPPFYFAFGLVERPQWHLRIKKKIAESAVTPQIDDGGVGERKAKRPKGWAVYVCVSVNLCSMCVWSPHLQRGQHYLFHRGEVGLPEELSLLSEGQDLILVDGAHRGGNLQQTTNSQTVSQQ